MGVGLCPRLKPLQSSTKRRRWLTHGLARRASNRRHIALGGRRFNHRRECVSPDRERVRYFVGIVVAIIHGTDTGLMGGMADHKFSDVRFNTKRAETSAHSPPDIMQGPRLQLVPRF